MIAKVLLGSNRDPNLYVEGMCESIPFYLDSCHWLAHPTAKHTLLTSSSLSSPSVLSSCPQAPDCLLGSSLTGLQPWGQELCLTLLLFSVSNRIDVAGAWWILLNKWINSESNLPCKLLVSDIVTLEQLTHIPLLPDFFLVARDSYG